MLDGKRGIVENYASELSFVLLNLKNKNLTLCIFVKEHFESLMQHPENDVVYVQLLNTLETKEVS